MSTDQKPPPSEIETNKPETDIAETLKHETETTSENSPPSQTTATSKPEADNAKALKQDPESDPNAKDIQQAETDTSSTNSPPKDAVSQTTLINNSKVGDAEDHAISERTSPTKDDSTATNKQETDGKKTTQPDSAAGAANEQETDGKKATQPDSAAGAANEQETDAKKATQSDSAAGATNEKETDGEKATQPDSAAGADPHVQEITAVENETASTLSSPPKNSTTQITQVGKPENDDAKAHEKDSATEADPAVEKETQVKNESTSEDSSPPNNISSQAATARKPETDEDKIHAEEHPNAAFPEISYGDDGTTSKKSSPRKTAITESETEAAGTLEEDRINDAAHGSKKRWNWKKLKNLFFPEKAKISNPKSSVAYQVTKERRQDDKQLLSSLIQADIDYITKRADELGHYNLQLRSALSGAADDFEYLKEQGEVEGLRELRKDMMKLKVQDPSKYKFEADEKDPHKDLRFGSRAKKRISQEVLNMMPRLHKSDVFERSVEFKDFDARFNELPLKWKLCLLCFSVFPENAVIKKRLMVLWWVAEGLASEDDANKCFNKLIEKGFLEPVNKNRSLSVESCQMHPFNRSALVMLAEMAKFFNFGERGEPTQNFSGSFQACLVGQGLISYEDLKGEKLKVDDLERLHLLINVDEHILDFKPDWFSKMMNLNFLYLGRWSALATDHIEVEDAKFLDGLENMICLKFLSLQGVSNIIVLPKSILGLANLNILDLRACYNLETIPERIEFLKNLTHLDMSECYLLDHMPPSLSSLKELRVLKGFVIGIEDRKTRPCCTLDDLVTLPKLIKLCIYTGVKEFPAKRHVTALGKLKALLKLTITWGGSALRPKTDNHSNNENKNDNSTAEHATLKKQEPQGSAKSLNGSGSEDGLPRQLEKLDLKCFAMSTTPYWLELDYLKDLNLKKLYIRGGRFSDLGQYQDIDNGPAEKKTWKVEVLRLKYLSEIEMEWRQLQELFPHLVYLEQVSCPKLTLFPCDANGVWLNNI